MIIRFENSIFMSIVYRATSSEAYLIPCLKSAMVLFCENIKWLLVKEGFVMMFVRLLNMPLYSLSARNVQKQPPEVFSKKRCA